MFGRDYLPFIIPIKSIKNAASSPIELYSKPSHFADLCRHAKYAHLNYIFSPDGACWHAAGPPRRVRACAKTVSTGRPAYGRPAGYHHEHTRPRPKAWVCPVARGASASLSSRPNTGTGGTASAQTMGETGGRYTRYNELAHAGRDSVHLRPRRAPESFFSAIRLIRGLLQHLLPLQP